MAGAIPIVQALKESLTGNRISSLMGILNGTSNYILSEMTSNGLDFDVALKQAQELGYAEADPTLDIDGHDAAHKLILLIRLAYGVNYPYTALSVRGIRGLSAMDIRLAREFGYRVKLIGQVREVRCPGTGPERKDCMEEAPVRLEAGFFRLWFTTRSCWPAWAACTMPRAWRPMPQGRCFFTDAGPGICPRPGPCWPI